MNEFMERKKYFRNSLVFGYFFFNDIRSTITNFWTENSKNVYNSDKVINGKLSVAKGLFYKK